MSKEVVNLSGKKKVGPVVPPVTVAASSPISELVNVTEKYSTKISTKEVFPTPVNHQITNVITDVIADDILADSPINELTIRDKVAIEWKKPVSNKAWLNKLIISEFQIHKT